MIFRILKYGLAGLLAFAISSPVHAQVVINEIAPSNISVIQNSTGTFDDWIELYNSGTSPVNLAGYGLTDDITEPYRFIFLTDTVLQPGERLLVFATGELEPIPDHFEMAVNGNGPWKYVPGSASLDTNWRSASFNDNSWLTGNGGIGFTDGDDETVISPALSVMMRKSFMIDDTSAIINAIFMMDYDDGFVAYLNDVEIARSNLGTHTICPEWNTLSYGPHEAHLYQGLQPDSFFIDQELIKTLLRPGKNVLAVETHDYVLAPTDMSSIPFLFFGMKNPGLTYSPVPSFFPVPAEPFFMAPYKLSRQGETLYLVDPSGTVSDQQTYPPLESDHSYARLPDGGSIWCYQSSPTPLTTNNSQVCYEGYAFAPNFSVAAGFYNSVQSISISTTLSGAEIRYTINGDVPTVTSPLYSSTLNVSSTTTIRARVFAPGLLPGPVITNSYIINEDIHLPVFCVTTDSLNLWDYNTGIYVLGPNADSVSPYFGANFWQPWEKPASIEFFDKSKNRVLTFNSDIEIFGNYSRYKPQKSFEIKLSDKYGTGEINYSFISDKPYVDKFDRFVLRNSGTDWNKVHFRDALMQRIMRNTNCGYVGSEPAVMFLNGNFWGVYMITEKNNTNWIKSNYNYSGDEIDYLEEVGEAMIVMEGTDASFWNLYNYATQTSPASADYYQKIDEMLNLKNFADYFIAETYYNNGDWIGEWTNNIKLWRPSSEGSRWNYILHDLDFGLGLSGSVHHNTLEDARNPEAISHSSDIFDALLENPQFKRYFINRYADLINTIYLPDNIENELKHFRDSMDHDMKAHFLKWGSDSIRWYTHMADLMRFADERPDIMREFIEDDFNMTEEVTLTLNVSPVGAGRIEISTVTPLSYPWTGVYFDGNPVTITAIPNPGYTFDHWHSNSVITTDDQNKSATYNFNADDVVTAYFTGNSAVPQVAVSEINYNPNSSYDAGDWIELNNYSSFDLDISGWKIRDEQDHHVFTVPTGIVIPSNGFLVIAEDMKKFASHYPDVLNVTGPIGFNFGNNTDAIRVYDYLDNQQLSFYYSSQLPWPLKADGQGYTCELSNPAANPGDGNNWYAGCFGGSPGTAHSSILSTIIEIDDDTLCENSSVLISTLEVPSFQYSWMLNGNIIPDSVLSHLNISNPGIYSVAVSGDGCYKISGNDSVESFPASSAPEIIPGRRCGAGTVLLSAISSDGIAWYDSPNGKSIATGNSFMTPAISQSTTYYAETSGACPSDRVAVQAIIESEPCENPLYVFPNPVGNRVTILSQDFIAGKTSVEITDMSGKLIAGYLFHLSENEKTFLLSTEFLVQGLYILKVTQEENELISKIVKLQ